MKDSKWTFAFCPGKFSKVGYAKSTEKLLKFLQQAQDRSIVGEALALSPSWPFRDTSLAWSHVKSTDLNGFVRELSSEWVGFIWRLSLSLFLYCNTSMRPSSWSTLHFNCSTSLLLSMFDKRFSTRSFAFFTIFYGVINKAYFILCGDLIALEQFLSLRDLALEIGDVITYDI